MVHLYYNQQAGPHLPETVTLLTLKQKGYQTLPGRAAAWGSEPGACVYSFKRKISQC